VSGGPITPADFDREAIDRAARRVPADRLRDGLVLFDRTVKVMADGIRHERPDADANTVLQLVKERLELARTLERS
jgi:hypothetical protein